MLSGIKSQAEACAAQAPRAPEADARTPLLAVVLLALAAALCLRHWRRVQRLRRAVRDSHREQWAQNEASAYRVHEGLVQSLVGVVMQIHAAAARLPQDHPQRPPLERALARADRLLTPERRSADGPGEWPCGDDLGTALSHAARCLHLEGEADVEVISVGRHRPMQAAALYTAYRIAREAILNALRHAQASRVTVAVIYGPAGLSVRIRDDGTGFYLPQGASRRPQGFMRMQGLAQRLAGSLSVLSILGGGTAVEFRLGAGLAYQNSTSV